MMATKSNTHLHDRTGRLETSRWHHADRFDLHDRTGRLES
ncbi:hypothetical protein E9Q_03258 [Moraxella catarrhalis BC1]|nr:hypothetical protein E9Q_03258 [Moraxella catarrhalis BC1]